VKSSDIAGGSAMLHTGMDRQRRSYISFGQDSRGWFSQTNREPLQIGQAGAVARAGRALVTLGSAQN
jgi:hypothetical protein